MERMIFTTMPEDEFFCRLADAIVEKLQSSFSKSPNDEIKKWLTHSEAADYIRKSRASLYKLTSERKIKYMKRGKQNYYLKEHLDNYLSAGEIPTVQEIKSAIKFKSK